MYFIKNAKYINYRQLGIRHTIKHKLLQDELASIVNMFTNLSYDTDVLESVIGELRFL